MAIDYVLLANTFHVPDQGELARAVRDVLKPGGLFGVEAIRSPTSSAESAW